MEGSKHEKAVELIKQEVAAYIGVESNRTTMITVTSVELSPDWGQATVRITAFPDEMTQSALDFLYRRRDDIRDHLKKRLRIRKIPFLKFDLDVGEKHRQHMDDLFNREEENK